MAGNRPERRQAGNGHHGPDGGEYKNPVRVVSFNTSERWSEDVSEDVAREIRRRFDLQLSDVPSGLQDFVERHERDHRQLALRLA